MFVESGRPLLPSQIVATILATDAINSIVITIAGSLLLLLISIPVNIMPFTFVRACDGFWVNWKRDCLFVENISPAKCVPHRTLPSIELTSVALPVVEEVAWNSKRSQRKGRKFLTCQRYRRILKGLECYVDRLKAAVMIESLS